MQIWDVDCHLAGLPGRTSGARLARLLEAANRMGIARLCVYMGMTWSYDPLPTEFRKQNDDVLAAIRRFPNHTFGFVYLNPKYVRESLDELNRCVADGP